MPFQRQKLQKRKNPRKRKTERNSTNCPDFKKRQRYMLPYRITEAKSAEVPVLISVPHCGTAFPDELKSDYRSDLIGTPDDTDWYVDRLYDFAPSLGMTMISAVYSRWVIDLNRDPENKPLYSDGRIITGLCPTTDFRGQPLYADTRQEINKTEVERRLSKYYWPYHNALAEKLQNLHRKFGKVLVWDCHSIRQKVPTIYNKTFPDLILGDADETSASPDYITMALKGLKKGTYDVAHNYPFKGGYITRHYGNPAGGVQALQLEMTKVNYMEDEERKYDPFRAEKMRMLLKGTLRALAEKISAS
jgi:N-formylglutamate deformylase